MPNFQVNVYVKDININSYYVEAEDRYEALDKAHELMQEDLYLDIEDPED